MKSIALMVLAITLLVVPGALYNNMNNNGLVVSQTQTQTCSSNSQVPTCQISGNVGCQSSSAYCGLSGRSISFLSHTSIFTKLFSDPVGLVLTPVGTSATVQHGPFDLFGGGPYIKVNCGVMGNTGYRLTQWAPATSTKCIQVNTDNSNMTTRQASNWTQWNSNFRGTSKQAQIVNLPNATLSQVWNFLAQINYTFPGGTTGYTYYGQEFFTGGGGCCVNSDAQNKNLWGVVYSVPYENGKLPTGMSHQIIYAQLEPFSAYECYLSTVNSAGALQNFRSQQCQEFVKNLKAAASAGCTQGANSFTCSSSGGGTSSVISFIVPMILFVIGVLMVIIGFGLQFGWGGTIFGTGTQFSLGSNEQGSRLAQTLGLGLVVWTPLYSEFSDWFTTGKLPYGLDGTLGIVAILLTGLFFFGVFWRALSRD